MRIIVAAIGRMKQGPESELSARYQKRAAQAGRQLGWRDVELVEIRESRAGDAQRRMLEESIALANVIPEGAISVLLDSDGDNLDSAGLATQFTSWRASGRQAVVFLIGGADGVAPSLREKVETLFWMEERGFYGIAIDGQGQLCRVLSSNPGHLLFCGLPTPARARKVSDQLLSGAFNSGWGLRTLAAGEARFNPISYHNGSVWPHDTALCVIFIC